MNIVRDQPKTLTWLCCAKRDCWNAAKMTAEVYWRIHERKQKHKHKQLTQSEKTDSRTFVLSSAFIVLRIYCITVWYLSLLFHHLCRLKRGDYVNIFGNFKDNVHWRINQRKFSSMSKIIGILIYWSSNITSMKLQRGTIKQL